MESITNNNNNLHIQENNKKKHKKGRNKNKNKEVKEGLEEQPKQRQNYFVTQNLKNEKFEFYYKVIQINLDSTCSIFRKRFSIRIIPRKIKRKTTLYYESKCIS